MHRLEMIILDEVTLIPKDKHCLLSPCGSRLHIFIYKSHFSSKKYLQHTETITENSNQSQYKEQVTLWCPAPADASTVQLLHLRLRDNCGRGSGKIGRARGGEFAVGLYLLVMSGTTPIKSHQHDSPNMS